MRTTYVILFLSFLLSSCALKEQQSHTIKIDIDSLSSHSRSDITPSTISNFTCYFVNLRGTGGQNYKAAPYPNVESGCMRLEAISNTVDKSTLRDSGVSLTIPRSSSSAELEVYGVTNVDPALICAGALKSSQPKIYLIARKSIPTLIGDSQPNLVGDDIVYDATDPQKSIDKNQYCKTSESRLTPFAVYGAPDPNPATVNAVIPAGGTPSLLSSATQLTPDANGRYTYTSSQNHGAIDLLYDVTDFDPTLVKNLFFKGKLYVDSTSTPPTSITVYHSAGVSDVITPADTSTNASNLCQLMSNTLSYGCVPTTFPASALAGYSFRMPAPVTSTANGTTVTTSVTRTFVQVTHRYYTPSASTPVYFEGPLLSIQFQ